MLAESTEPTKDNFQAG